MVDNSMLITGLITVLVLLVTTGKKIVSTSKKKQLLKESISLVVGLSLYTKKQAKTTVLLLGINDAGKTAMYTLVKQR
jgi:hypothetical protein